MSLTAHVANNGSLIGHYLWRSYNHTAPLAHAANQELGAATTLRPDAESYPWATVSRAMDYRIRYSFGVSREQIILPARGAQILAALHDEHYDRDLLHAFFAQLEGTLDLLQPSGRQLDQDEERILARYCYVLALLEEVARTNRYEEGPLFVPATKHTVEDLLAIPDDVVIDDMSRMGLLFWARYGAMTRLPHSINPRFAGQIEVGSTDADLIVDGCLINIKTTVQPKIDARWLRQLVGYTLLDYHDRHHLHSVGIYMARQGILLRWPIADFVAALSQSPSADLPRLRQEFQRICQIATGARI